MSAMDTLDNIESLVDTQAEMQARNIAIGKEKKEVADAAFKAGDIKAALRSYYEALLYLKGVEKQQPVNSYGSYDAGQESGTSASTGESGSDVPPPRPKTESELLVEKIYSNMSACHMKQENWQRGLDCAEKALHLNEKNYKAAFRKGKALGELGYIEKCEKILEDLLQKNPDDAAAVNAELAYQRAKDKEREKKHNKKMRGFLSREKDLLTSGSSQFSQSEDAPITATITEIP